MGSKLPPKNPMFILVFPAEQRSAGILSTSRRTCSEYVRPYAGELFVSQCPLVSSLLVSLASLLYPTRAGLLYFRPVRGSKKRLDCRNSLDAQSAHNMGPAYETPLHPHFRGCSGTRS